MKPKARRAAALRCATSSRPGVGVGISAMTNALRTSMPIVHAPAAMVTKTQGRRSRPGVVCAARSAARIAPMPSASQATDATAPRGQPAGTSCSSP